ncbi:hypothetical protein [Tahibacter amnicola]|uniref:Uncharacterized protein n=1 Tax=Tahibacter amnicola TaxID=2976241 RepID=A0ABY6BHD2_9GAMM|nr:hypothetical protein [Tahibacter amnicola]UXI69428.1 hypothetical protein N4264_07200 [Tahibacter amnicola]
MKVHYVLERDNSTPRGFLSTNDAATDALNAVHRFCGEFGLEFQHDAVIDNPMPEFEIDFPDEPLPDNVGEVWAGALNWFGVSVACSGPRDVRGKCKCGQELSLMNGRCSKRVLFASRLGFSELMQDDRGSVYLPCPDCGYRFVFEEEERVAGAPRRFRFPGFGGEELQFFTLSI